MYHGVTSLILLITSLPLILLIASSSPLIKGDSAVHSRRDRRVTLRDSAILLLTDSPTHRTSICQADCELVFICSSRTRAATQRATFASVLQAVAAADIAIATGRARSLDHPSVRIQPIRHEYLNRCESRLVRGFFALDAIPPEQVFDQFIDRASPRLFD